MEKVKLGKEPVYAPDHRLEYTLPKDDVQTLLRGSWVNCILFSLVLLVRFNWISILLLFSMWFLSRH